jgi:hypothetical protein
VNLEVEAITIVTIALTYVTYSGSLAILCVLGNRVEDDLGDPESTPC